MDRRAAWILDHDCLWDGVGNPANLALVFAQLLFRALSFLDVGVGPIPSKNLAGLFLQRFYSDEEPAVSSIVATKPRFDLASCSGSYQRPPLIQPLRQVFGVDCHLTPHPLHFFLRQTRVVRPSPVNKVVGAIRQVAPRQCWNRVDDLSEPRLGLPRFL